jgi:formate dehydrogenase subunit gamma
MNMNQMVRKATTQEIIDHWVMAISFFLLAVTGFAFLFQLKQLNALFGNFTVMRFLHNWGGLVFTASVFYSMSGYLKEAITFTVDDVEWIKKAGGYLSRGKVEIPPQGILNAGQKLFYLAFLFFSFLIIASGFVIWLLGGVIKPVLLAHFIHNVSFDFLVFAIPAHIYLGSLANPGTFRIMVYGTVPLAWARKRHGKWVKEQGL